MPRRPRNRLDACGNAPPSSSDTVQPALRIADQLDRRHGRVCRVADDSAAVSTTPERVYRANPQRRFSIESSRRSSQLANIGVHGRPVQLHLEKLWDRNIEITTRLVDTAAIPMLLKLVQSGKLQPAKLVTHRFALGDMMKAYDTFGNAASENALKVILTNPEH